MKGVQKVNLILKSFDASVLEVAVKDIMHVARKAGDLVSGPIPLPTKIKRFTVNKSTHVNKKSREQFEIRFHKRLLGLSIQPTSDAIDSLMKLDIPSSVDVSIKIPRA